MLVSGSWHTEFHIQPCIAPFQRAGYLVVLCPQLRSTHWDKQPPVSFPDDVGNIYNKIAAEASGGHDVCVLSHSSAASCVCEAINRFLQDAPLEDRRRLTRLFFVGSFLYSDRARAYALECDWYKMDLEKMIASCSNPAKIFYNDMSDKEAQPFIDALTNVSLYRDEVKLSSDTWKQTPRTYIVCLRDNAWPLVLQRIEAEKSRFENVDLDAGHCPFISLPEKFVQVVDRIVSGH